MNSCVSPNAVVIDTGSFSTKVGFAGDEEPQSIVRTATATMDHNNNCNKMNTDHNTNKFDRYLIDASLNTSDKSKISPMEIQIPYKAGTVLNMDCLASVWFNTMRHNLRMTESQISHTPLLLSEASNWCNSSIYGSLFTKFREDYCRIVFEEFDCPAMYLCKDAVLSSFAHAKKCSIVFDLGAGSTRCIPVYDGYVINKGCKYTKCAALYFDELLVDKLLPIKQSTSQKYVLNEIQCKPHASYQQFMRLSMMSDLRESVFRIRNTRFDVPNLGFPYKYNDSYQHKVAHNDLCYDPPLATTSVVKQEENVIKIESDAKAKSPSVKIKIEKQTSPAIKLEHEEVDINAKNDVKEYMYTLPDGQRIACGDWKYCIPELLFVDYDKGFASDLEDDWIQSMTQLQNTQRMTNVDKHKDANYYENTQQIWNDKNYKAFRFKGLASMVLETLNGCDIDIRPLCARNVIISGGHSRYKGFIERLSKELSCCMPYSYKYKLHLNDTPRERLLSPWLGGSILSSTSNFQSMWITKEQYTEYGPSIVHRKCF